MNNHGYMADVFAAFTEAGAELDCLERLSTIASEAGQENIAATLDRMALRVEDRIGELHNELRTAGWSEE